MNIPEMSYPPFVHITQMLLGNWTVMQRTVSHIFIDFISLYTLQHKWPIYTYSQSGISMVPRTAAALTLLVR